MRPKGLRSPHYKNLACTKYSVFLFAGEVELWTKKIADRSALRRVQLLQRVKFFAGRNE